MILNKAKESEVRRKLNLEILWVKEEESKKFYTLLNFEYGSSRKSLPLLETS